MDTSNSAKISPSDNEDLRMKTKTARCIQHSLSKAMAEALYQPHTLAQPKPLASRVKDAGKEFLRHNQTCQWIQFIQDPPQPMEKTKEKRPVKIIPCREITSVQVKEAEISGPPIIEPPPSMQPSPPSYEEQLRSVHRQQEALLVQQHHLEDQMEQEKKARQTLSNHDLEPRPTALETPEVKEPPPSSSMRNRIDDTGASNCPPSRFRRRLKGSIAQSFAERDEGSIGSLLYNTKAQESPGERKSDISSASYRRYPRPNLDGRHYATWQESSSNISQMLCSPSYDSMRNASESSATITDTLLTELTIEERKGGHGDF